jgi:hypothetical protein
MPTVSNILGYIYIYIYIYIPEFPLKAMCYLPVPFFIHGETTIEGTLTPSLSNLKKKGAGPTIPSGLGTPFTGVAT